ncbi:Oligosaccharyl transferase STT3 subunit-domain-containing protein [Dunaliella salina]|uniref:dolichyl-diphosphooligosaccharide--protein glycotransferase n=1 Tax=Dunaliella salina TaxID=3046 RepID=A0ABQ7GVV5_DUNSA|nr:Oligosaccharyl transferase STT3 subunit-domain-containing protein [Dunaliella salina]|eukprot:KAF5838753.1 Oligosaccharyl transferase STT3 subunit-domain-containing protein [Dunaliella salina]
MQASSSPAKEHGMLGKALQYATLTCICILSFSIRLFSVVKYESVIHEFDPYFNYRVTQFLTTQGFYDMWNWFDDRTWYPLGRGIGGTTYPGLIFTAGSIYRVLHALNIPIHIQEVCVFTAPLFSALCALACYGLVREVRGTGAGMLASAFVGMVPSYISRSVAGSYDNEGVAIFALVNVFFLFVKARVQVAQATEQGQRVAACPIPIRLHRVILHTKHKENVPPLQHACIQYSILASRQHSYVQCSMLASSTAFLRPVQYACVQCSMLASSAACLRPAQHACVQCSMLASSAAFLRPVQHFRVQCSILASSAACLRPVQHSCLLPLVVAGVLDREPFRIYCGFLAAPAIDLSNTVVIKSPPMATLCQIWDGSLQHGHAASIPVISFNAVLMSKHFASIPVIGFNAVLMSEHFGAFLAFVVLHAAMLVRYVHAMLPPHALRVVLASLLTVTGAVLAAGLAAVAGYVLNSPTYGWTGRSLSLLDPTYASRFIPIIASVSEHQPPSWTFYIMDLFVLVLFVPAGLVACLKKRSDASVFLVLYGVTALYFSGVMVRLMLVLAPISCCLAAVAISDLLYACANSIKYRAQKRMETVMVPLVPRHLPTSVGLNGMKYVFDDFREAYSWLRHNTHPDAKIASWWDYGYQTSAMSNRTVIVDNNTWNNTHIATVGRAMSSSEYKGWKIYRSLDVDYVLVVFGGVVGYPSDDINKFLWMVRIGGGVYPDIVESDYLAGGTDYRIDAAGTKTMHSSLMYRLCYHEFADESQMSFGQRGYDRVRGTVIGKTNIKLQYFEEVFTSQHWMMRIYRVRDAPVRTPSKRAKDLKAKAKA